MAEHRRIRNGEDNLDTCTACAWASWDTSPSFADHAPDGDREGWASYAAEQERHAETAKRVARLEARLARSVSWSEVIRALRAADVPEDSMATDDDLLRHEGRAEAVAIMRDMLEV